MKNPAAVLCFPHTQLAAPSAHSHETLPVAPRDQEKQSLEDVSHPVLLLFFISHLPFYSSPHPHCTKALNLSTTSSFPPAWFSSLYLTCNTQELVSNFCIHPWGQLMQQKSQEYLLPFFTLLNLVPINLLCTRTLWWERWPFSSRMMLGNAFFLSVQERSCKGRTQTPWTHTAAVKNLHTNFKAGCMDILHSALGDFWACH